MSAPSAAKAIATALPIPESPPVMSATLPRELVGAAIGFLTVIRKWVHEFCQTWRLLLWSGIGGDRSGFFGHRLIPFLDNR